MNTRYAKIHKSPVGPGDSRPTAAQTVKNEELIGKWADKVFFITGVPSGLGVETAKALFPTGAVLYLTARDLENARNALGELCESPRVHLLELDLDSLDSVRACAEKFLSKSQALNVFIAHAGAIVNSRRPHTKDGFETQFGSYQEPKNKNQSSKRQKK